MPGAYPTATVGHGQQRTPIVGINLGREKGVLVLRRSFARGLKKCV
jgi:hypothetical protein